MLTVYGRCLRWLLASFNNSLDRPFFFFFNTQSCVVAHWTNRRLSCMLTSTSNSSLQWKAFSVSCIFSIENLWLSFVYIVCFCLCVCVFRGVLPHCNGHVSHFPSDLLFHRYIFTTISLLFFFPLCFVKSLESNHMWNDLLLCMFRSS